MSSVTYPMGVLHHRLFCRASDPWEDETLALKAALIGATESWETLKGEVRCVQSCSALRMYAGQ